MGSVISPPINFDVKKANDGQLMQVYALFNYEMRQSTSLTDNYDFIEKSLKIEIN